MLLAGGERENEAAITGTIDGLADETTGHLADELLFGCEDSAKRPAITQRHAEGLRLQADDIRFDRWANDSQRNRFRDGNHQQRAFGVGDFSDGRNILDDAEEVGTL